MVEQRKTHFGCAALIYLSLLLSACSNSELTIIELQHINPTEVENIIARFSKDDIQYDIVNQKIIFYAPKENIKDLAHLLNQLDSKPNQFLLSFSWGKIKRYSTIQLPSPIIISPEKATFIHINRDYWQATLHASNNKSYSLNFIKQLKDEKQNLDIKSVKLSDGTKVKFKDRDTTQEDHGFSITLTEGIETKINEPQLPQGLYLKLERF